ENVVLTIGFIQTLPYLSRDWAFKTKLPFPEYTGGNDVNKAAMYILWRFTQLKRACLSIYPQ
ncbi:hypothetical protein BY996DRAFT_4594591, partial [Phakopsora pachyrhizi]